MSVNIDALFQHLMEDPDIIPPEGEDKEDIAMAMARQRAKQSNNNTKALSMASADRSVSKLLYFLKAEDDDAESASGTEELKPEIDPAEFRTHVANFDKHNKKVSDAKKQGKEPKWDTKQQVETAAAKREKRPVKKLANGDEISVKGQKDQDDWEAAYDYLNDNMEHQITSFESGIERALEEEGTGEEQEAEDVPEDEAPEAAPETPAPKGKESFPEGQAGESPSDVAERKRIRALPEGERQIARAAFTKRKIAEADAEADATKPHHSLTSAVDALSDAPPDVELDNYGNDPDSPFHADRFGHTSAGAEAFNNIHGRYSREDLAQAYDQIESQGKQRAINFDGKDGGSLVESAIHRMMDDFFESTGRQEAPSAYATPAGEDDRGETAKQMAAIEDSPASNWFEANVPDKGADATAWDQYVSDNFGNDLSKVDEDTINGHLESFRKGRGLKTTTPPKPTPTAEHVAPEVQKEIVIASQDADDPKQAIEAKLAEHTRSTIDNPVLTPHQKKVMIDGANALAEVTAKKVSTPEKEITIEPPDDADTSEAILEHAADIHIEAEANGATDTEKTTAADNVHQATLMHEAAGGDAEEVLNNAGVEYKKLKNGQHYFQSSTATKSRGDWGTIRGLAARDAGEQPSEGETTAPAVQYPQKVTQGESQAAFDFDAPAPSPVEQLADKVRERQEETPPETGTDDVTEKHMQAWLDNHVGQKEDPDYEPRRNQIEAGLRRQLEDEPGLLEEGKGWGEIRQRAEANNFMPELEEVKPTEEAPEETPTPEPEPKPTEGEAEPEVQVTPPDAEAGEAVAEPVVEPTATEKPARKPRQRKPKVTPEAPAEEAVAAEPEVAITPDEAPDTDVVSEDPSVTPEETPEAKTARVKKEKDFLLANKMTPDHLESLSDEEVNKEFKNAHKKISDKAMADNLKGIPDKEEVIQDMADAVDRGTDEEYKETLRKKNKYTSVQDLIKQHKENQQRRADSAFEHASNDANSSALKMDVLPEEGTDKLHALDRARDIAKKMDTSNRAVKNGGKPLLDRNSMSHLKDLLDDAMDKGDLQQDEIDGIADEADRMGEDYLTDDHKASIDADNERQRAHHEEFQSYVHDKARSGHALDHINAGTLHSYDKKEDGTAGERTGASYHSRNEDGSVEHLDGRGIPGSDHDAVADMGAAEHPPKLLGLNDNEKIEQIEHFELMKKAASATEPLPEEDIKRFRELEAKNPALATPQYKGNVLGGQRHMMNIEGEDGKDAKNRMGIDEKDHDEADKHSCRPPAGETVPPPSGSGEDAKPKDWNPATHRWCDKDYLDEKKGEGNVFHPEGINAGTKNASDDHDENGVPLPMLSTPTGVFPVHLPTSGLETSDKHGSGVGAGSMIGSHLKDHPGGKVDDKTMEAMGFPQSKKHTKAGQSALGRAFKASPGMQMAKPVLGKLGGMLQRNKKSEEGKPNATGQDRQRARRGTDGSPIKSVLSRIGDYTKEGLKDAAEEAPGYLGGGMARDTDRYRDKQTRKAVQKVGKQQSAAQKLTDSINRVAGENG